MDAIGGANGAGAPQAGASQAGQQASAEDVAKLAEAGAAQILFGNIMGMYREAKKQTDEAIKDSQ